jgi:adenosine deaminase
VARRTVAAHRAGLIVIFIVGGLVDVDTQLEAALDGLPRERLPALLRAMPKAELHIHIEGSLEPELIFALAARHGLPMPAPTVDALRARYAFTDLQSFLDIYYAGASVLLTEDDFCDLASAYFARAAADRVVRAEVFFDPQTHTTRGVPFDVVMRGLERAAADAERRHGMSVAYIMCFLRHLSEQDAFDVLDEAEPHLASWPRMIGFGLDSSERGHPPEQFARVFARGRALGRHVVAHAGEEGPPAYIHAALDVLRVERVDHGVRCLEDPALVERLVRERIPLTVCPLSNYRLRVFDRLSDHNLDALLRAGLCATVHSDDPAYFGGYITENFVQTFAAKPTLTARDAFRLARNAFAASFASPAQKDAWIAAVRAAVAEAAE